MNITRTGKAVKFVREALDTTKTTVAAIEFKERKPIFYPREEMFFEGCSPEECGIESNRVFDFIQELHNNKQVGLQSIMLMRNGKVLFEADKGMQDSRLPKATFSECKSIISLAVGALVTQGKLRLSEKLVDIFPAKIPPIAKIRLNGLTVKHLLTMTAGITFNEIESAVTSDWFKAFVNSDAEGEFGKDFRYNSLNSYIIASIIKERTRMTVSEYLDATVFGPLEITDYYWEKCPFGTEKGGWGLYIHREDMAKLGLLVMNKGVWNGKKIIAPKYIEDATKAQVQVPDEYGDFNYGFHIWCGRSNNTFLFNGMLGQNLLGYRDNGIIIVANCGNCDMFQQNDFFRICDKYFATEFTDRLEENPKAYEKLIELREELKKKPQTKSFLSIENKKRSLDDDLNNINGKRFRFECANARSTSVAPLLLQIIQCNFTKGIDSVEFLRNGNILSVSFEEGDQNHILNVGFDAPELSVIHLNGEPFTVYSEGRFSENEDGVPVLTIDCVFCETPYTKNFKFYFDSNDYRATFCESPGIEFARSARNMIGLLGENAQKFESLFDKLDGDYISVKLEKAFSPRLTFIEDVSDSV